MISSWIVISFIQNLQLGTDVDKGFLLSFCVARGIVNKGWRFIWGHIKEYVGSLIEIQTRKRSNISCLFFIKSNILWKLIKMGSIWNSYNLSNSNVCILNFFVRLKFKNYSDLLNLVYVQFSLIYYQVLYQLCVL